MKRFITKIIAIALAFTVLFATTSFTVSMHYCCDRLVDMAVLGKAGNCNKAFSEKEKPSTRCSVEGQSCCKDRIILKDGDDSLKQAGFELETKTFISSPLFFYHHVNLFEGLENNIVPFQNYVPPLIWKDIQLLHQTFLI